MNDNIDEFSDLLGAYALDALDPDERQAIEDHLATCPRCRAEVAEHREVASFLSQSGAPAPEGVWDRIAAELSPPAPALRMTFRPDRGRPIRTRTFVAVVSAAAALIAVLGLVTVSQSHRIDRQSAQIASPSLDPTIRALLPRAKLDVRLKGTGASAQAVVGSDGRGYLLVNGLPVPVKGHLYQLWGKVDGTVLSLGTFGDHTPVVPFQIDPSRIRGVQAFAVTQERAPGVIASTQPAVVAGTV